MQIDAYSIMSTDYGKIRRQIIVCGTEKEGMNIVKKEKKTLIISNFAQFYKY